MDINFDPSQPPWVVRSVQTKRGPKAFHDGGELTETFDRSLSVAHEPDMAPSLSVARKDWWRFAVHHGRRGVAAKCNPNMAPSLSILTRPEDANI